LPSIVCAWLPWIHVPPRATVTGPLASSAPAEVFNVPAIVKLLVVQGESNVTLAPLAMASA
jgi:hypothetical protein